MVIRREIKVGVGHRNARAGERHYRSKLTDHEVGLILELFDEGRGLAARDIAHKFEVTVRTVYRYISGERRVYASYRILTVIEK